MTAYKPTPFTISDFLKGERAGQDFDCVPIVDVNIRWSSIPTKFLSSPQDVGITFGDVVPANIPLFEVYAVDSRMFKMGVTDDHWAFEMQASNAYEEEPFVSRVQSILGKFEDALMQALYCSLGPNGFVVWRSRPRFDHITKYDAGNKEVGLFLQAIFAAGRRIVEGTT